MNKFDEAVRDAVRDLSDQGRPPVDLGRVALAAGRRMHYRRTALTAAGAVVAAIAVAAPVLAVDTVRDSSVATTGGPTSSGSPQPIEVGTPPPTGLPNPPLQVPAKLITVEGAQMVAAAANGHQPSYFYDAAKQKYVKVPYRSVVTNPARTLALVRSADWPGKIGLLDLRTNKVDWTLFEVHIDRSIADNYAWSRDGTKAIIGGMSPVMQQFGFVVFDVASRTVSPVINVGKDYGLVTFHPNGTELVATKLTPQRPTLPKWIQAFDLAGKPTHRFSPPALIRAEAQWAPDGRRLVTWTIEKNESWLRVYDTVSGKVVADLRRVNWMAWGGDGIQWLDAQRLLITDWDRDRGKLLTRVIGLDGRTESTHELPWYGDGYTPVYQPPAS